MYQRASGQSVNYAKSAISFSKNTPIDLQQHLGSILGVQVVPKHGRYLGLPLFIGRNRGNDLCFIIDKIWKKLQAWKNKSFSFVGKEVLLKSIAQALPVYLFDVFLLPNSFCQKLESLLNSFWWSKARSKGLS